LLIASIKIIDMKIKLLSMCILCLAVMTQSVMAQDVVNDLLGRINNLRSSLGLYAYGYNSALAAAAQNQAQWMAENGDITHTRPDGNTPRDRAAAAGYGTTAVSENIYGGTMAGVDDAWNFWINSSIHYAGLTSTYYSEIGIGTATTSWGSTFVLVFGNPGGPPPIAPQVNTGDSSLGESPNSSVPPSYVMGVDENGNIMHQVQPGDTIGYIALLYGYTWDDIPYMLQINGMADARELEEGSIFLVPPYEGTYTPTPSDFTPSVTPTIDPAVQDAQMTADAGVILTIQANATYTVTPLPRMAGAAMSATPTQPESTRLGQAIAMATTPTPSSTQTEELLNQETTIAMLPTLDLTETSTITASPPTQGMSPWVMVAIGLQIGVLGLAGAEYAFRGRRKKKR
jgi:hypothetical protein